MTTEKPVSQNRPEMVILYGIWGRPGDDFSESEFLATFDNKDLAEEYVIKSIVRIVERGENDWENRYEFKPGSLLEEHYNFDIQPMKCPHNPTI